MRKLTSIAVVWCLVIFGASFAHAELVSPASPFDLTYEVAPTLVTSDGFGTHVSTPGTPMFGLNHDGVSKVTATLSAGGSGLFSGALLSTGRHLLTAAHNITGSTGNINVTSTVAQWDLVSGPISATVSSMTVHPQFTGNVTKGFDVAILEFDQVVSPLVPRYELIPSDVSPLNKTVVKVGYGRTGVGDTGQVPPSGTKRVGLNEWEANGLNVSGITNPQTQLTYDFDNGLVEQDAFNFFYDFPENLGFGDDEVMAAPGDSGGPSFIEVDGVFKIAGVASYALRVRRQLGDGSIVSSDIDDVLNSSFGEFGVDALVTSPEVLSFIVANVPEPTSGLLLLLGMGVAMAAPRRRAA